MVLIYSCMLYLFIHLFQSPLNFKDLSIRILSVVVISIFVSSMHRRVPRSKYSLIIICSFLISEYLYNIFENNFFSILVACRSSLARGQTRISAVTRAPAVGFLTYCATAGTPFRSYYKIIHFISSSSSHC